MAPAFGCGRFLMSSEKAAPGGRGDRLWRSRQRCVWDIQFAGCSGVGRTNAEGGASSVRCLAQQARSAVGRREDWAFYVPQEEGYTDGAAVEDEAVRARESLCYLEGLVEMESSSSTRNSTNSSGSCSSTFCGTASSGCAIAKSVTVAVE